MFHSHLKLSILSTFAISYGVFSFTMPSYANENVNDFISTFVSDISPELVENDLFAKKGEESDTVVFEISPEPKQESTSPAPNASTTPNDAPSAVATVYQTVPTETIQGNGIQISAGASKISRGDLGSANFGFSWSISKIIEADVNLGVHFIDQTAVKPTSQVAFGVPQVTSSLRMALLHDRIEAGVGYQGITTKDLNDAYVSQLRSVGYDIRVNLLEFSDKTSVGNKLYFAVTGFKKGSLAPTGFTLNYLWKFNSSKAKTRKLK